MWDLKTLERLTKAREKYLKEQREQEEDKEKNASRPTSTSQVF